MHGASASTHRALAALVERPLWLAPMAGVSDRAFRTMCLRRGAGLTCTEMVSAAGLAHGNAKTWELVCPAPEERTLAVQLFGHDPALMAEQAAAVAERLGPRLALVDVNMGCPVRKVVGKGEGCALMDAPETAAAIVSALVEALPGVPVTAKFRSGFRSGQETAPEFARRMEAAGASLVCVHGRSAEQLYSGTADWDVIARVKQAVCIPVAGSGDVFSHADAQRMREQTGADVAFIARGAQGNPWVFSGACPTPAERIAGMREHYELYVGFEGTRHLAPLRSRLCGYVHGLPGAAAFRRALAQASTPDDFEALIGACESRVR